MPVVVSKAILTAVGREATWLRSPDPQFASMVFLSRLAMKYFDGAEGVFSDTGSGGVAVW
jgi:hypothetical protein